MFVCSVLVVLSTSGTMNWDLFQQKTRKEDEPPYGLHGVSASSAGAAARLALPAFASTFAAFATEHRFAFHSADTWDFWVGG